MSSTSLQNGQAYNIVTMADMNTAYLLDVNGYDNKTVQMYTQNHQDNQIWIAVQFGAGWALQNKRTGLYLSLSNYCATAGNQVALDSYPIAWQVINVRPEVYSVKLPTNAKGLSLDVKNGTPANETPVIVYTPGSGQANQQWNFVRV